LIKSISGIRGTIGGTAGSGLTPPDVIRFTSGFGAWLRTTGSSSSKVVIGRDARVSGPMVRDLVAGTLTGMGFTVVDLGLSTTPTVEMAVTHHNAAGGIIITASHNPKQWNALKLLNHKGEFVSAADGEKILELSAAENVEYSAVGQIGAVEHDDEALERHIDAILAMPLVDIDAIRDNKLKVVVDGVNSSGGIAIPRLLQALGVHEVVELFCEPTGLFPHNPEPLPEHLSDLSKTVQKENAHIGIVVDPDVDRLALVCEDGEMFGEEYTLVAVADYVLGHKKGNTVSNLSSSMALRDVTEKAGGQYFASAVGEVNVVNAMKENNAVIGGEGNGGVIVPELHYGRDALAGIALFLSHLALSEMSASRLRASYPNYFISKNKIELTPEIDVDQVLDSIRDKYASHKINDIDGVKIEFDKEWVHLRRSNTEPIIRIYSESGSETTADNLARKIISDIKDLIQSPQMR
jgi:phosphomannomutase